MTCSADYAKLQQKYNELNSSYNTQINAANEMTKLSKSFMPSLQAMLCNPECQRQKQIAIYKQQFIDAQNIKATAPSNLHVARKNYVVADLGEPEYNNEIELELTAQANIIAKTYNDQFDFNINQLELLLTTFNRLNTSYNSMKHYNTNLLDSTQYGSDELALNKDTVIMNDRKTYYETQNYDLLKDWYKLFSWIFWLLFIIFALSLLLVKNELSIKIKGVFIVGIILYYFVAKYILIYFFKFLHYLYQLFPKTVYNTL